MLPPSKRLTCYLYEIVDDLGTIRYVGKGTGKRRFTHSRIVDGLITGRITRNAAYVHRQMAAAIQAGRTFSVRLSRSIFRRKPPTQSKSSGLPNSVERWTARDRCGTYCPVALVMITENCRPARDRRSPEKPPITHGPILCGKTILPRSGAPRRAKRPMPIGRGALRAPGRCNTFASPSCRPPANGGRPQHASSPQSGRRRD